MTSKGPCPFCAPGGDRSILAENRLAFAIYDKYPVSPGHALVIPKRHAGNYFDLSDEEKAACWRLADAVKHLLQEAYHPDAFNLGVNCGVAAGQTVLHAHIHVIPRYAGDVANPRGGVRGVIPGKGDYGYG